MWYELSRTAVRAAFRVLWPTTVVGVDKVPAQGPVILASNHQAFMDSILIPAVVPRRVVFIAKSEYFTGSGVRGAVDRAFFTAVGAVPVDRELAAKGSATAALEQAAAVLRDGLAFGIYPEGTRSRTGMLHRGRTGVAWLALQEKVPVVPVAITGTARAQDIATNALRPFHQLRVEFADPVYPGDYVDRKPAVARRALTDDVMAAIARMSDQPVSSEYAPSKQAGATAKDSA